jgi:uncharacterized protein YegP (UPF0339 family)
MRFVVVPEPGGRWTWMLRSEEGTLLTKCSESWLDRDSAIKAIELVRARVSKALIFDPLGSVIAR